MPRKKQRGKGRTQPPLEPLSPFSESRAAENLTVAWMMSVMTTVICGGIGGIVILATRGRAGAEGARTFGALLHFGAFVAAVLSLVLLALVLKYRRASPPQSITWFAVIVAFAAIATTFLY